MISKTNVVVMISECPTIPKDCLCYKYAACIKPMRQSFISWFHVFIFFSVLLLTVISTTTHCEWYIGYYFLFLFTHFVSLHPSFFLCLPLLASLIRPTVVRFFFLALIRLIPQSKWILAMWCVCRQNPCLLGKGNMSDFSSWWRSQ